MQGADNTVRWREGERLDHLFEQRCDELDAASGGTHAAIISSEGIVTFRELDDRANQTARYLIEQGILSGDRVGLLFDKSVDTYVALLAVLKVNAAYVPFDGGFPNGRIGFIVEDAGVKAIVSQSAFRQKLDVFDILTIFIDASKDEIDAQDRSRITDAESGAPTHEVAYLISEHRLRGAGPLARRGRLQVRQRDHRNRLHPRVCLLRALRSDNGRRLRAWPTAFLMKGERRPAQTIWQGNPVMPVHGVAPEREAPKAAG